MPVHRVEETPVRSLQSEVNRLFDDFFRGFELEPFSSEVESAGAFEPEIDVVQTDSEVRITAELPGVEEKDLDLSLRDDLLTLQGEKREERSGEQGATRWTERRYGAFRRTVPLSCEVDADGAQASFRRGVLTVRLPRTPESQRRTRRIEVRSG